MGEYEMSCLCLHVINMNHALIPRFSCRADLANMREYNKYHNRFELQKII